MFDPTKLVLFLTASAVLILTPGPAVLYIFARSVSQGRRAGLVSVAGVGVGNFVHALGAALGLSAILAQSALAYAALKYVGAAYLVFLGLRKFFGPATTMAATTFACEPLGATFRQAVFVGVLNPKTALFFLAFLPQFADASRGAVWVQLLILGSTVAAMGIVSDACYALLSGVLGEWLKRHPRFLRSERYLSGTVYCGLGLATALSGSPKHR